MQLPATETVQRFYQLTFPFVTAAAVFTLSAILATQWQGPWLGAVLAGVGSLGSVLSSSLSRRFRAWATPRQRLMRWTVPVAWSVAFAVTILALEMRWPVWTTICSAFLAGMLTGLVSVYRRQAAAHWGGSWVRMAGPTSRVGATAGAAAGSFVAITQWWPLLVLLLLLPLSSPLSFAPLGGDVPTSWKSSGGHFFNNALFALLAVGPVAAMPSLVTATIGAAWVGPAMAVYAAGAIASPWLVRRLPSLAPRGLAGYLTAGALSNASWLLIAIFPVAGLMVSRAFSGAALFAAEGSADVAAAHADAFGPAIAGRSLGVGVAGLGTGALLAATGSVLATTGALAAVAAVCAAASAGFSRFTTQGQASTQLAH